MRLTDSVQRNLASFAISIFSNALTRYSADEQSW